LVLFLQFAERLQERKRLIFDVTGCLYRHMLFTEEGKILINNLLDLKV